MTNRTPAGTSVRATTLPPTGHRTFVGGGAASEWVVIGWLGWAGLVSGLTKRLLLCSSAFITVSMAVARCDDDAPAPAPSSANDNKYQDDYDDGMAGVVVLRKPDNCPAEILMH